MSNISAAAASKKKYSQEDIINMKKELLYQFDRLEKKGVKMPKRFTMASSLEEMKAEYERLKRDREVDISVRFQRKMLMAIITGLEFMNNKFDPFDVALDGWSENVNDGINDYDDIFEELHDKYKGKANMSPELKLMFALGGSAFMFHLRNTMFKSALSGIADMKGIPRGNEMPGMNGMPGMSGMSGMSGMPGMPGMPGMGGRHQEPPVSRGRPSNGGGLGGLMGGLMGGGGIGSIIGSLFGGGGGANQMPVMPEAPRAQMRGPSNVEDILRELNGGMHAASDGDRMEVMSTLSESELSEIPDDVSANGMFVTQKKKGGGRTLNL
jgi:hypothetical protein